MLRFMHAAYRSTELNVCFRPNIAVIRRPTAPMMLTQFRNRIFYEGDVSAAAAIVKRITSPPASQDSDQRESYGSRDAR